MSLEANGFEDITAETTDEITTGHSVEEPVSSEIIPSNGESEVSATEETDDDVRKLFVGGLSWETTEEDLRTYFSEWGKVTQCIIKVDRNTGNSRGFGFVTFENEESVATVLSIPEHKLNNKRIDPKKAKPSREALKKIFVGGIDPDLTEDQIKDYFGQFGRVDCLNWPYDNQKGKRKHYIFVSFVTEAAARKAIAKERQEIFGHQCDVRVAVTREQANRNRTKQWLGWVDTGYAYPNYSYNDYANAYQNFDPYAYAYYGYDYFGNPTTAAAGTYGACTGFGNNFYRNQLGVAKSNHMGRGNPSNRQVNASAVSTSAQHPGLVMSINDQVPSMPPMNTSDYSGLPVQQHLHQ